MRAIHVWGIVTQNYVYGRKYPIKTHPAIFATEKCDLLKFMNLGHQHIKNVQKASVTRPQQSVRNRVLNKKKTPSITDIQLTLSRINIVIR